MPSTFSDWRGAGIGSGAFRDASTRTVSFRRPKALRALTTLFQLPMAMSIGARARAEATEAAMIDPAVISPRITR